MLPYLVRQHHDRADSFDLFFNFLASKERPLVIETGCARSHEDYSAGYSTYIFGQFLALHGGKLISVDIDAGNVGVARSLTESLPVEFVVSDSVAFFKNYRGPDINALYLDSLDTYCAGHEEHCLAEAQAALPHMAPDGLILIDDTPDGKGKGTLAVPWLTSQGLKVVHAGYQIMLAMNQA
jgi:hypothetical protein